MGLFGFGKKKSEPVKASPSSPAQSSSLLSKEEQYGKAWLMIVGQTQKQEGLQIMRTLDAQGYTEATVVLGMFPDSQEQRKHLVKKAADAGNVEGIWEYCGMLPHAYCPNPNNAQDALWEKYCLQAAESGSVDAMNEMGNVCNRRNHYAESMYWYAMANSCGQPDGEISLRGIARKWEAAGCPRGFVKGSPKYDAARHKCAIAYLEMNSNQPLTTKPDDIIPLVLDGVPIAAYLAGEIFEGVGDDAMAYRMYNAIAFENDPHGLKCYADMLFLGKGVGKDIRNAVGCYQKAAELGDRESMFTMGEILKTTNKSMAAYWYGLAHTRGYEHALTRLIQLAQRR